MIKKFTLDFLKQLSQNNEKSWFDLHKEDYLSAKKNFEDFVSQIIKDFSIEEPDFSILKAKDCVFRIYRDVRFSKDKTPYKTHFAAGINKGGKRVHVPGYYLHINQDGNAFFGSGHWRPEKEDLSKIRQEIDYNFDEFKSILDTIYLHHRILKMEDVEALKKVPKGYEKTNPAIDYLKMKSFVLEATFNKKEVLSEDFKKHILDLYHLMKPFNAFIERALD